MLVWRNGAAGTNTSRSDRNESRRALLGDRSLYVLRRRLSLAAGKSANFWDAVKTVRWWKVLHGICDPAGVFPLKQRWVTPLGVTVNHMVDEE
jgi:hypothetical protein